MVNDNGARTARNAWIAAAALAGLSTLPAGPAARAAVLDRAAMIAQAEHACPGQWTELLSPFLGAEVTLADPWPGPSADRDDFLAYLAVEMADEGLTGEEIERLANDPMVVIAECSHKKLRLARYLAAADAEIAISTADMAQEDDDATSFPDGLTQVSAATSCEAILAAWPDSDNGDYWIDPDGGDTANASQEFCLMVPYPDGSAPEFAALSCNEIKVNYPESGSGVYWLDVDGGDTANAYTAWCDMTVEGGGWTLVAAQFETDQLEDWSEGIQDDYDPTLATGRSFALNGAELPAHAETAFGKSLDPVFVDYADFVYTPFDIQKTFLVGKKTGRQYEIHREGANGYKNCDPEDDLTDSSSKVDRLTFDETGGRMWSWCYSPHESRSKRGTAMLEKLDSDEPYAWTVWVR